MSNPYYTWAGNTPLPPRGQDRATLDLREATEMLCDCVEAYWKALEPDSGISVSAAQASLEYAHRDARAALANTRPDGE